MAYIFMQILFMTMIHENKIFSLTYLTRYLSDKKSERRIKHRNIKQRVCKSSRCVVFPFTFDFILQISTLCLLAPLAMTFFAGSTSSPP